MKSFITARPEAEPVGVGSSFEPVLTGVAHGLARLFPPIRNALAPHDDDESGHAGARRDEGAGGENSRGS